jgi:hypothetical protein
MATTDLGAVNNTTVGRLDRLVGEAIFDHQPAALDVDVINLATKAKILSAPRRLLTAESVAIRHDKSTKVSIAMADLLRRLEVAAQSVTLLGIGGNEGTSANKGQRAPMVLGAQENFEGIRISSQDQLYLLHRDKGGHPMRAITAAKAAGDVYSTDDYIVTLGSSNTVLFTTDIPDGARVTFNGVGPAVAGDTVADWFTFVCSTIGPLASSELNAARLALFKAAVPFAAGWYIQGDETIAEILDALVSAYAWWGIDNDGLVDVGVNSTPRSDYVDYEIPTNRILEAEMLPIVPPARSISTCYRKNPTEMSEDEIAGAAKGTADALWMTTPYTKITGSCSRYLSVYPSARTADDYVTPFLREKDALLVHSWLAESFLSPTVYYRIRLAPEAMRYRIGRVVRFSYPRWGLADPDQYRIAQTKLNANRTVELIVWKNRKRYVLSGGTTGTYLAATDGSPLGI